MGKIYKVAAPRRIDKAFLLKHGWSEAIPSIRFTFNKVMKLSKFPPAKVPAGCLLRLGCSSPARKLGYSGRAVPAAGITARPPENFSELKRVYRAAHAAYLKAWGDRVGGFFLTALEKYERVYLPKTRSLIMFRGSRPVALYSLIKYPEKGKARDLVAWHNPFVALSAAERRSCAHQAAAWMNEASDRRLAVGLDHFDKDSIKFFSMLGFNVDRIRVVRI